MRTPRPRRGRPRGLRLPRHTARLRLTVLYGGAVFLACGATVPAVTYLVYGRSGDATPPCAPASAARQASPRRRRPAAPGGDPRGGSRAALPGQAAAADLLRHRPGVIAVAAAAIGWLIAGRVLRPLSTITAAARRISASSLHERLALPGPDDELKELADTLDGLFARLEASFDAQRRFAASASHELRTPLTRERTLLQVTLADPAATTGTWQAVSPELLASNAEQEHLIEALLTLASSEAGPAQREPADLAAITSAALAAVRPAISRLGLHVQADIQPAALDGDPLLVQQLAANLIDNAVRHNVPGGHIQITTGTSRGRRRPVGDQLRAGHPAGRGRPPVPALPAARPAPRPPRRRHGLGLSIVRAIATAHAATITAQPRPGGGLAIDVSFPPPTSSPAWRTSRGRAITAS